MGYKEVASLDAESMTAIGGANRKTGKKNPSSIEGYYLGTRQVVSKKSKDGLASIHFLQTTKGNVGVWGKTDLDRKIETVSPGTMIRVTHTGMQTTPNGDMYKYKVEVDQDNTIDVAGFASDTQQDDSESSEQRRDEEDNNDDDESISEEVTSTFSSANAKERQARVQNILNKNKKT